MPNINTGKDCSGCTACFAVCPKDAITMEPDVMGFKYPKVDISKCIECGQCERVCAFNDHYDRSDSFEKPIPFGVRHKDISEVMKSRSGGAFVAFSDYILSNGGVIYGAGFGKDYVVEHQRAETRAHRDSFRGSKYVQSDLGDTFVKIKKDLETKQVLFSGTPCQVAGLKSYLPKKLQSNLITVDIVCHGVPSPRIWREYLTYTTHRHKGNLINVDFRNKNLYGWKAHKETFEFLDPANNTSNVVTSDTFTNLFYQHIIQRPSCGNCKFCNVDRPSDLTLADFWGWEKTDNRVNSDDKGLSLILINSEKGVEMFESVRNDFNLISPTLENCMQPCLQTPYKLNPLSDKFVRDYQDLGFKFVLFKYSNIGLIYKFNRLIKRGGNSIKRIFGIT